MFCTKCGAEAVEGADFCTKCGTKLGNVTLSNPTNTYMTDTYDA